MSNEEFLIPGETVEDYENTNEQQMGTLVDIGMFDSRPEKVISSTEINRQMMAVVDGEIYLWDNSNMTVTDLTEGENGVLSYGITVTVSDADKVEG